ncbi:MAG: hypothetical protein KDB27_31775 [Planctomycetales bacterium]|nr:hypothetical protein [Planctomycetales bacterium]
MKNAARRNGGWGFFVADLISRMNVFARNRCSGNALGVASAPGVC